MLGLMRTDATLASLRALSACEPKDNSILAFLNWYRKYREAVKAFCEGPLSQKWFLHQVEKRAGREVDRAQVSIPE